MTISCTNAEFFSTARLHLLCWKIIKNIKQAKYYLDECMRDSIAVTHHCHYFDCQTPNANHTVKVFGFWFRERKHLTFLRDDIFKMYCSSGQICISRAFMVRYLYLWLIKFKWEHHTLLSCLFYEEESTDLPPVSHETCNHWQMTPLSSPVFAPMNTWPNEERRRQPSPHPEPEILCLVFVIIRKQ